MQLDILMVIAEIAVALAGFSAIASNFSRDWTPEKSALLTNLLTHSGIALFASMVPLIMSQRVSDSLPAPMTLWFISRKVTYSLLPLTSVLRCFAHKRMLDFSSG